MPVVKISSLDDPRLDVYARLTEAQLRNKLEPEKGIFIAESLKVISRALDGGMEPVSVLMTPEWVDSAAEVVARVLTQAPQAPVFVAPKSEVERLAGFNLTRGILCAMRRPALPSVEDLLATCVHGGPATRIAVLEGIVDHTNVGAIFRSAAALGIDAVLVTPTCCDPLYRRAVRVSMGTVFQVPWTRIGNSVRDWPEAGLKTLHDLGFATAAMALSDDSIPLGSPELAAQERLALIFGTEGDGLSTRTIAGSTYTVKIPMRHGVDSLNVAAASAVAFWELARPTGA
ncbi:MAG: RNA methyltransferase [Eggerthellales bacterium]|nr:RNA methyltransferase [Eggerthellales bacterium]